MTLEVTVEPTVYEVTAYPFFDENRLPFTITVEQRAPDSWAVKHLGSSWNRRTKQWDYEPLPSSRTDAFKRTHRFPLEEALSHARTLALHITINGWTVEQAIAEFGKDG